MSDRNLSIDALRAIAALGVLFYHSTIPPFPIENFGWIWFDQIILFLGTHGRVGVDLFFVLSGFCIHWAYTRPNVEIIFRGYLLRRWWRIYPPYFFALGVAVVLNLATNFYKLYQSSGDFSWHNFGSFQILSHVFLVHNLFSESAYTVSGLFWTIAVEAQFYLLYLAVLPMLLSFKGWSFVAFGSILLAGIAYALSELMDGFQPWHPFMYWPQWIAGAGLANLIRYQPNVLKFWPIFFILFISFAGLYGCWTWEHFFSEHIRFYVLTLSIIFLILFFLRFGSFWAWRPFRWVPAVGMFSYSLYLVHFPIMDRVRTFMIPNLDLGGARVFVSIFSILLIIYLSYLFFIFFEKPFLDKASQIKAYQIRTNENSIND